MTEMSPAEAIFFAALEKTMPEERAAYLDAACGTDADLRRRVDRLLAAHPQVGSFLGQAAITTDVEPGEGVGSVLAGRYKLLEAIGEGGMGSVFMAQQTEPVKRLVALKLIKTGMDSNQVLARFEAERQALALMDHPNIAKVFDAGTTASGRPFFVMELVKGTPITKFSDDRRLSPRERLELFVPVCQAIQHAHQKGIIHRDVKPSNVLIALYDGKPVPKVIDFGVAKAAGQPLTDRTLVTGFGAIVGTLEYMSPEQAETNQLDVDTRSDVYALGVLLYELLTGTTPIGRERLRTTAVLEVLRLVREEEAPRPSVRLSSSEGLPSIALNRQTEPAKLSRLMRGELDWIVMKALDKDRTRRYETANGLAQDVQRYLTDEQVEACPPSTGYRLRKFLRRHKGPVLAATLVLLALVGGVVGTTWGLVRASRARDAAATQRAVAETATKAEAMQRAVAEETTQRAFEVSVREAEARKQAEKEKRAAQFQAFRAETARHAISMQAGLRAWEQNDLAETERLLDEDKGAFEETWEHRYLRGLCRRKALPLLGHARAVSSVSFSPDGTRLASASQDGKLKVWDAQNGQELLALALPGYGIVDVCFSPDGKRLVAGLDRTLKVWDAQTGKELLSLKGHTIPIISVAFSPDGKRLASGGADGNKPGEAKVWDAQTGVELLDFKGHIGVTSVAFSPDSKRLASGGGKDNKVKVWDAQTGKELLAFGISGTCIGLSFSPDGKRLATVPTKRFGEAGSDNRVKVWDAHTGVELLALKGHTGASYVCFSPDGNRLATAGGFDRTVKVWDAQTGAEMLSLKGHTYFVSCVSFSPDGKRLASGSWDRAVRVWDPAATRELFSRKGHDDRSIPMVFRPDGKRFASTNVDKTVKVWETQTGVELLALKGHTVPIECLAFSPDGKRIASGGGEENTPGELKIWDAQTGVELLALKGHTLTVQCIAFSSDGKRIASGSCQGERPGEVKVWDAQTGVELLALKRQTDVVMCIAFSPDGRRLASGSWDKTVKVWDAQTGTELLILKGHTYPLSCVSFSSDGKRLASVGRFGQSRTGDVKVWDAQSGQELFTLKGHRAHVNEVSFSPDGKRIISGSGNFFLGGGPDYDDPDYSTNLWDAETGQHVLTLKGMGGKVTSAIFSSDGRRIIVANIDGSVRVWDAPPLPER